MIACKYCAGAGCRNCEHAELLGDLRRAVPPIETTPHGLFLFSGPVAIDCEWDRETGALSLIGIGNHDLVVQLWWQTLDADDREVAAAEIIELIRRIPVVYHNADADIRKLRQHGIPVEVAGHFWLEDTMLAHAVLHCEEEHTLEFLCEKHGKLPGHKHLMDVDLSVYNACDVVETLYVWDALELELTRDPAAAGVYRGQSLAKLPYVIADEERGLRVNQPIVYPLRDKLEAKRRDATGIAQAYTGWPINIGSPDQLKDWVYGVDRMPIQWAKAAPREEPSPTLDKDALAVLRRLQGTEWDPDDPPTTEQAMANIEAGGHPVLEARYLYYGAQQALSHYIDPCCYVEGKGDKKQIVGIRERIYPETRMHVQASGRDSIVGPALQQLKGELEQLICPDPGWAWLTFDWSNVETWVLGVLAGDELILEARRQGWDTHTLNFCTISRAPLPPVLTKALHTAPECAEWRARIRWQGEDDLRRVFSKRFVYRIHYLGDPANAGDIPGARALGFDADRLVEASESYLGLHHWLPTFWDETKKQIDKYGVVYTWDGRPRRLTSPYRNARYREGCNHPMQGGVAGIYNTTRLLIHQLLPWLRFAYGKHDAQVWACPEDKVDVTLPLMQAIVEREFTINGTQISFPASFKPVRRAA